LEDVAESQEISNEIVDRMDAANKVEQSQIVTWLLKATRTLSLARSGTRVVQKALEVANSSDRDRLVESLLPFVDDLYDSPHGNHVLTKIVEVVPSAAMGRVIDQLLGKGRAVARHRFGCRVLERLIEHCDESQIGGLIDEIVPESLALCRHLYGNFVISHLIEHSVSYRGLILESILPDVPLLASHRIASHVVQKIMDHSDKDGKQAIVASLLQAESPNSLPDIACSRYGSYVVEQLAGMMEAGSEVKECIAKARESLSQSEFGKHVLECYGLTIVAQEHSLPTSNGTSKL
jgi:mRNA-binding protein PUF3